MHLDSKCYFFLGSDLCPVKLFQLYISKLNPKRDDLWQKPKKDVSITEEVWYDNVPVGPHPLNNFMKQLSEKANLSRMYTNHCIRSTCITNLDESGFEARHITAVSGHKSETTIKNYSVKCPEAKKREMADALSGKLLGKSLSNNEGSPIVKKSKISETVSVPTLESDSIDINFVDWVPIENNAEDFDLDEIITKVANYEKE